MTTTTTSLIDPTAVDEPQVVTPCECPEWAECGAHGTGPCERTAQWMLGCAHCIAPGDKECSSQVRAVCGPCLEQMRAWAADAVELRAWAADAAAFMDLAAGSGGRCPLCGGKVTAVSDLIRSVVPL